MLHSFLKLNITTEAMGILRFAGASLSQSEKVNAGEKPTEYYVSQQVGIDVCYGL
jgi:hypothetical protein